MSKENFSFNVLNEDSQSRVGQIYSHRGNIDTPAFMPVGTQATIKSAFIEDVLLVGTQMILSNTYHLMIRPGIERIKKVGGLHEFMNCNLPILTDSGGFQIMSSIKIDLTVACVPTGIKAGVSIGPLWVLILPRRAK